MALPGAGRPCADRRIRLPVQTGAPPAGDPTRSRPAAPSRPATTDESAITRLVSRKSAAASCLPRIRREPRRKFRVGGRANADLATRLEVGAFLEPLDANAHSSARAEPLDCRLGIGQQTHGEVFGSSMQSCSPPPFLRLLTAIAPVDGRATASRPTARSV